MGKHSRRKGADGEREIVSLAHAAGLDASRTWHLAQSPDAAVRRCDVRIAGRAYQVKRSRDGFGPLYEALSNVAGLFVRTDGREWLAVLPAETLLQLLKPAARSSAGPGSST
jgi:hypothetical protein